MVHSPKSYVAYNPACKWALPPYFWITMDHPQKETRNILVFQKHIETSTIEVLK